MQMAFGDYEKSFIDAFDKWVDTLFASGADKALPYKDITQTIVTEWKTAFPSRRKRIDDILRHHYARRF